MDPNRSGFGRDARTKRPPLYRTADPTNEETVEFLHVLYGRDATVPETPGAEFTFSPPRGVGDYLVGD